MRETLPVVVRISPRPPIRATAPMPAMPAAGSNDTFPPPGGVGGTIFRIGMSRDGSAGVFKTAWVIVGNGSVIIERTSGGGAPVAGIDVPS